MASRRPVGRVVLTLACRISVVEVGHDRAVYQIEGVVNFIVYGLTSPFGLANPRGNAPPFILQVAMEL